MKWFLLVVILLALALNPSKEAHVKAASDQFKLLHPVAGGVFGFDAVVTSSLERQNYYLFSLGSMKDKVTTLGLLGMVWVINESPLK
jgi:hypothetical protein